MNPESIKPAIAAHNDFKAAVKKSCPGAIEPENCVSFDLITTLKNAGGEVLQAEAKAMRLFRDAYERPTPRGVLSEACRQAELQVPRTLFDEDNDFWEEMLVLETPLGIRNECSQLISAARLFALRDRMFSAIMVLSRLKKLMDKASK